MKIGNVLFETFSLLGRHILELFRRYNFAITDGGDRQASRCAKHGQFHLLCLRPQFTQGRFLPVVECFPNLLHPVLVLFAFKGDRENVLQVLYKLLHITLELNTFPGGQLECPRTVGSLEILQITPVGRQRVAGSCGFECLPNEVTLADAFRSEGENVIALLANPHCKIQGLNSSGLANEVCEVIELCSCFKIELGWIATLT